MSELEQELLNIQDYITKTYQIKTEIKLDFEGVKVLFGYAKKYDLEMRITDKTEDNYLGGCYGIIFDFNANKKYRSELGFHGGSRLEKYTFGDYKVIDDFLGKFEISKLKERQFTIFDY